MKSLYVALELLSVNIQPPEGSQLIIAQSHFIKTVEDVYECMAGSVPNIKFGIAFCEASGPCLIRHSGNDDRLEESAVAFAGQIGAGHSLVVLISNAYPVNVLAQLRNVPELVNIYCATANGVEVIVADTGQRRAILGVADGLTPKGIEGRDHRDERRALLRKLGYKE